ncbi:MAG: 30S ribosomal protein S7 [Candidatus Woesearchaeota archaeon]|nr:30S ribosomal protein S7 [Candidatus Woesearchaeota archaeon]
MTELLAFGTWKTSDIKIEDFGLQKYLTLDARFVPKTGARYAGKKFHKSKVFIIERLINKIMIPGHKSGKHSKTSGHCTGKAATAYEIMRKVLKLIEEQTKQNPVALIAKAIENAAPREEIVTIEYGGARYPKAVDCSPQRRIDTALRYFIQGAYDKCFGKKKGIVPALAEELIAASRLDARSLAIQKKQELERQADSSR